MSPPATTARGPWWTRLGSSVVGAGTATGAWLTHAYRSIDPQVRTQLGESPLLALTLLASARTPDAQLPNDGQRLVLFVHGLGGHRGNFVPMQKYFGWLGRTRTVSIGFPDCASIEVMAQHLAEAIQKLAREHDLAEERGIDVVAHSMGGIITRLALEDPAVAAHIHTLITLATPHRGTQLARFADTQKIRELRPGSTLLQRLDRQLPWADHPELPELVCYWTPKDIVLLPPESARVPGAEAVCVPDSSHIGFLLKPRIWESIFCRLGATDVLSTST